MQKAAPTSSDLAPTNRPRRRWPGGGRTIDRLGHGLFRLGFTARGLGAFSLITLGVMWSKFGVARRVIRPLIRGQVARAGSRLLPMTLFVALVMGLIVIGQSISLLNAVGQTSYLGLLMVTVVVRELGPLLAALLVLLRVGAANVFDLGMARVSGEVEALEALGIDPIHYLVVPRVIGMAWGVMTLTVYLILGALASGYLWAFLRNVPLTPDAYVRQLAEALTLTDFIALAAKSAGCGAIIALVTCYHGLAQPLNTDEVSAATIRAVAQSLLLCVVLDATFIVVRLLFS